MTTVQIALSRARKASGRGRDLLFYLTLGFLALVVLLAMVGPFIAPYDPDHVDLAAMNAAPGVNGHVLGTDQLGRDIFSRLLVGTQLSMVAPFIVILGSTVLGIIVGVVSAWSGGWVDAVLSRIVDFLFAFPGLLLAVFAVSLFGPGLLAPSIALAIGFMPMGARMVRNLVAQEKDKEYVQSLKVLGFSTPVIFLRHIFPIIAPTVLSQSILGFGYAIVDLAAVSYLGLGVQPPTADWGLMINEGQSSILEGSLWPVLWPALLIVLVVVAFNYVGEHLVDRFNRRSSR